MLSNTIMEKTEQLNLRVSQTLLEDIDLVTGVLKIHRSEWIKTKLAEEAHKEKNKLLLELSSLYAKGMIQKKDIEHLVGKDTAQEMEFIRTKSIESARKGKDLGKHLHGKIQK